MKVTSHKTTNAADRAENTADLEAHSDAGFMALLNDSSLGTKAARHIRGLAPKEISDSSAENPSWIVEKANDA